MNINATLLGQTLHSCFLWPYVGGMYGPNYCDYGGARKRISDGLELLKKPTTL